MSWAKAQTGLEMNNAKENKFGIVLRWLLIAFLCVWLGIPRVAFAQSQEEKEALAEAEKLTEEGRALDSAGKYSEAEPLYQRSLEIREKVLGPEHPDVISSLNRLAWLYYFQHQYAKAEPLFERVVAIQEKTLGPEHPDVASSLNDLAFLYRVEQQYAKAEPLYQRSLKYGRRFSDRSIPTSLPVSMILPICTVSKASTQRLNSYTSDRWPYGRRFRARNILMLLLASTTWLSSTERRVNMPRRSHCTSAR